MKKIFLGPHGLRSGWRLLIFFVIVAFINIAFQYILLRLPHVGENLLAFLRGDFGPVGGIFGEAITATSMLIGMWIMAKIERRRIGDYGWRPSRPGAALRLFAGFLFGVLLVAAMYTLQWAEHVYSFGTWAIPARTAIAGGLAWAAVCFLVGIFEEGTFRGYAQFTLASGIGFWPAAVIISSAFGLLHLLDPNYTWLGVGGPAIFGLLFAFCLWRTGDLWLAIGIHMAVDFSELFLFAPANSFHSALHLLRADLHGPAWLTGWTIGPEASVNGYAVLALACVIVWAATRESKVNWESTALAGQPSAPR